MALNLRCWKRTLLVGINAASASVLEQKQFGFKPPWPQKPQWNSGRTRTLALSLSVCFLFYRGILGLFLDENFSSRNQLSYLRCLAGGGGSCLPAPLPGPVPLLHHAWPHGPCVADCAAANSKTNTGKKDPKKEKEKKTKSPSKNNKPKQKFLAEKVRSSAGDALLNPQASRSGFKKHVEGRPVSPKSWFKPQQQSPVGTEEPTWGRISSPLGVTETPARRRLARFAAASP